MRLIDADALPVKHGVNVGRDYGGLRAIVFKRDIDKAQTIDAVEVVRCKECRYFKRFVEEDRGNYSDGICDLIDDVRPYDWFCADGERRSE